MGGSSHPSSVLCEWTDLSPPAQTTRFHPQSLLSINEGEARETEAPRVTDREERGGEPVSNSALSPPPRCLHSISRTKKTVPDGCALCNSTKWSFLLINTRGYSNGGEFLKNVTDMKCNGVSSDSVTVCLITQCNGMSRDSVKVCLVTQCNGISSDTV